MDFVLSGNFKAVKHIHYAKIGPFIVFRQTYSQTLPSGYHESIRLLIFLDGVLLEM